MNDRFFFSPRRSSSAIVLHVPMMNVGQDFSTVFANIWSNVPSRVISATSAQYLYGPIDIDKLPFAYPEAFFVCFWILYPDGCLFI